MTSSVARRRGSSFTIAELIGTDADEDVDTGNHDNHNDDVTSCQRLQWAWQHQLTSGAFHVYRPSPSSVANSNNFYEACLNWMRRRGSVIYFCGYRLLELRLTASYFDRPTDVPTSVQNTISFFRDIIVQRIDTAN